MARGKWDIDGLPCAFGNVTVGPQKYAVAVTVNRSEADKEALEAAVVGGRLKVSIVYDPLAGNDAPQQQTAVNTKETIESVADSPSLGVKPDTLKFRLAFASGSIDVARIAGLAQKKGTMSLRRIGDATSGDEE